MKCFHVKRNFTFRKSPRAVLALGGLLEPGHVVGGGAVGGGGVAGGRGAQLAVVEGGELVPVCAHLLPVRQLLPSRRRLVALLLLVQEQLVVCGKGLLARQALVTIVSKQEEDAAALTDDDLVHLVGEAGGPVLGLVPHRHLVLQPGQQVAHRHLAQPARVVGGPAVQHVLRDVDLRHLLPGGDDVGAGTPLVHVPGLLIAQRLPLLPLIPRLGQRLPYYVGGGASAPHRRYWQHYRR